jgi:hypothetical protein
MIGISVLFLPLVFFPIPAKLAGGKGVVKFAKAKV